jgi:hypothetical protein
MRRPPAKWIQRNSNIFLLAGYSLIRAKVKTAETYVAQ